MYISSYNYRTYIYIYIDKIEKTEYIHALFPVTSCGIVHSYKYKCNTIFTQR